MRCLPESCARCAAQNAAMYIQESGLGGMWVKSLALYAEETVPGEMGGGLMCGQGSPEIL